MSSALDRPLSDIIESKRTPRKDHRENKRKPFKSRSGFKPRKNAGPCYAFQKGECTRGSDCRFQHVDADSDDDVEPVVKKPTKKEQVVRVNAKSAGGSIFSRIGSVNNASGTSITFQNLKPDISESDIKELCQTVGEVLSVDLKKKSGKSTGVADAVFARRSDALAAVKKFSALTLDGSPLKCELTGQVN